MVLVRDSEKLGKRAVWKKGVQALRRARWEG